MARWRRTVAGAIAAALLVVAAMASVAAAGSLSDPRSDLLADPRPAVGKADVDIRHVSVDRVNGKFVFTIKVQGSMGKALGNSKTAPAISIIKPPKAWLVQRKGRYGVFYAGNRLGAGVTMATPDPQTVKISFQTGAIGNPGSFKYHVTTGACTVYDIAPNSNLAAFRVARRC